jgi:hypothetical protein
MDKFEPHERLIDLYLESKDLPYKSEFKNPEIEICREFEIIFPGGLCRYDLLIINHSDKRYDILEFKSRDLMLKDAYQIFRYMKCFLYNKNIKKGFNLDYDFCFHLIGRDYEDERLDNLVMLESPFFKIHVFYDINSNLEVYPYCPFNIITQWT